MVKVFCKLLDNKKINFVCIILLIFVSLFSIFPAGSLNSSSTIENTSEYLADVAKNHTKNGKYAALMIEPNDTSDGKINNPYIEFHFLYGIFKEGMATYAGTVSADKSHDIRIKEIDESVNFSILNVDSGFGTVAYYTDDENNTVYKQEFYPLELMFYSNHPAVPGAFSFLYISQSQADVLLDRDNLSHTLVNYKTLLNSLITVEFDGVKYNFAIDNIYYERNYFYEALHEVMGDFFLAGAKYPTGIKRQGMFFLRNYSYQNKFYIDYATALYSSNDFDYKVLDYNFDKDFKLNQDRLIFFANKSTNSLSVAILVLCILFLILASLLIFFGSYEFSYLNHAIVGISMFMPYIMFSLIHKISGRVVFFSNFSVVSEMWCILGLIVTYLLLFFVKCYCLRRGK